MEDRNKLSTHQPDHVKAPKDATSVPTDPFRSPMRGDMNMPSPTTQAEEATAKPYEGQMREHERLEEAKPVDDPHSHATPKPSPRPAKGPTSSFRESPKASMPPDDHNDPFEPTAKDVEMPPPVRRSDRGEKASKGGSRTMGNDNPGGSPRD